MKNIFLLFFIILTLFSCDSKQPLTALEIWHKHLDTFGDKETIMQIENAYSVMLVESKRGIDTMMYYRAKPDKSYMEIVYSGGGRVTYIVNGDQGIIIAPDTITEMSESRVEDANVMSMIYPEMYFEERGYTFKLLEDETISDTVYYQLELTGPDETTRVLIRKDDFTDYRIYGEDSYMDILETKEVDGCRIVSEMRNVTDKPINYGTIIELKWNVEIPDSIFDLNRYQKKTY